MALNYVSATYFFEDISMVGLSGGGWTTAAFDVIIDDTQLKVLLSPSSGIENARTA